MIRCVLRVRCVSLCVCFDCEVLCVDVRCVFFCAVCPSCLCVVLVCMCFCALKCACTRLRLNV